MFQSLLAWAEDAAAGGQELLLGLPHVGEEGQAPPHPGDPGGVPAPRDLSPGGAPGARGQDVEVVVMKQKQKACFIIMKHAS